eukprot:scaffold5635_cov48-Phaeocystis_antarctica.AAC.1
MPPPRFRASPSRRQLCAIDAHGHSEQRRGAPRLPGAHLARPPLEGHRRRAAARLEGVEEREAADVGAQREARVGVEVEGGADHGEAVRDTAAHAVAHLVRVRVGVGARARVRASVRARVRARVGIRVRAGVRVRVRRVGSPRRAAAARARRRSARG